MTTRLKKAVGITRISDDHRQGDGHSEGLQLQRLTERAALVGFDLFRVYEIQETASKPLMRRRFQEIKAAVEADPTIESIVVDDISRFARNLTDLGWAMETARDGKGIEVYALRENLSSVDEPLLFSIHISMAKQTAYEQSQKALTNMPDLAKRGYHLHRAPMGAQNIPKAMAGDGPRIQEDPVYMPLIRQMFKMVYEGKSGLEVEHWLRDHKVLTRDGNEFGSNTVYYILRNRFYVGQVQYGGEWFDGLHEPLVQPEIFWEVQRLLDERSRRPGNNIKCEKPFWLKKAYAPDVYCPYCADLQPDKQPRKMTAQFVKGNGGQYVYYICSMRANKDKSTPECRKWHRQDDLLDRAAVVFDDFFIKPDVLEQWEALVPEAHQRLRGESVLSAKTLEDQKAKLLNRVNTALDRIADGDAQSDLWSSRVDDWQQELSDIESKLIQARDISKMEVDMAWEFVQWCSNLKNVYLKEEDGSIRAQLLGAVTSNLFIGCDYIEPVYHKEVSAVVGLQSYPGVVGLSTTLLTIADLFKDNPERQAIMESCAA